MSKHLFNSFKRTKRKTSTLFHSPTVEICVQVLTYKRNRFQMSFANIGWFSYFTKWIPSLGRNVLFVKRNQKRIWFSLVAVFNQLMSSSKVLNEFWIAITKWLKQVRFDDWMDLTELYKCTAGSSSDVWLWQ